MQKSVTYFILLYDYKLFYSSGIVLGRAFMNNLDFKFENTSRNIYVTKSDCKAKSGANATGN